MMLGVCWVNLSKLQFHAIAKGKNSQEIAELLNVPSKTINVYRHRIHKILDIPNDISLVQLAIKLQLIDVALL